MAPPVTLEPSLEYPRWGLVPGLASQVPCPWNAIAMVGGKKHLDELSLSKNCIKLFHIFFLRHKAKIVRRQAMVTQQGSLCLTKVTKNAC